MKRQLLHLFFLSVFIGCIALTSVNYLWCSNVNVQLIEEEIAHDHMPVSKKHFTDGEDHLSLWLSDFMASQRLFDHGVEIQPANISLPGYSAHLPVETPPPDRA